MSYVVGLLIPLGAFTMISWIVYTVVNGLRMWYQQRMLNQFQTKLLERIGSVNELGAFLNTEAGTRFLKGLTTVTEAGSPPQARILRAVQSGAVLATVGIGLYLYGWMTPTVPGEVTNGINAVATILFGIGVEPRDRALLWLAYVEGESHEEIASSLGVGRGGVKVMLFRARRRLRDLLQARGLLVNS